MSLGWCSPLVISVSIDPGAIALTLMLCWPISLELAWYVRIDLFRTLAEVAGALLGFFGIVGVYGLDSVRSRISDNSKRVGQLQGEYRRLAPKLIQPETGDQWPVISVGLTTIDFQINALREQNKKFEEDSRFAVITLFGSAIFSFVTIVSSVFGISGVDVPIPGLGWRVLLLSSFYFLFVSIFFIVLLIVNSTWSER